MFGSNRVLRVVVSLAVAGVMLGAALGLVYGASGAWQASGVNGGWVGELVTADISPTLIYARTGPLLPFFGGSGVWKSADGGENWEVTSLAVEAGSGDDNLFIEAMAVSGDGQTIYAASSQTNIGDASRIWRSVDGGESWSSGLITDSEVQALAIFDNGRIGAGSADDNDRPLFYSDDGLTWMTATIVSSYSQINIYDLAEGSMYAGGAAYAPTPDEWYPIVLTSSDGINWSQAFTIPPPALPVTGVEFAFYQLVPDPTEASRVYGLVGIPEVGGYVISSTNRGQDWDLLPNQPWAILGIPVASVAMAVDSQGRLYTVDPVGQVYRSTDRGQSWSLIGQPEDGKFINSVAVDPNDDSILYFSSRYILASSEGVYRTPTGYQVSAAAYDFSPANTGLKAYWVIDVAAHSGVPDTVYAGTYGQGLIKSVDGGQSWSRVSEGVAILAEAVAAHPSDPNIAYFAGGNLLSGYDFYRTGDGVIWEARSLPDDDQVMDVAIDPATPTTLYAAVNDDPGLYKTVDEGENWFQILLTPTYGIDLHPTTPTIVYAGVDNEGHGGSGVDAVYQSTNGGSSWMQLAAGNDCVMDVIVNPISPTEVYASGCNGVFLKSVDEGASWTTYPITPSLGLTEFPGGFVEPGWLAYDSQAGLIYLALGIQGLVTSADGGQTWSMASGEGLPPAAMFEVFYQAGSDRLFLGTSAGLWQRSGERQYFPIVVKSGG